MPSLRAIFSGLLALALIPHICALSVYAACQTTLGKQISPTLGCPAGADHIVLMVGNVMLIRWNEGTIYVSQTDSRAKFKTVQEAVQSLCGLFVFAGDRGT
jgi:hypothetical protein